MLFQAASIPMIDLDNQLHASDKDQIANTLGLLKFQRDFELEADYFGIQYVYKSGYDTSCFLNSVRSLWPDPGKGQIKAFLSFPPVADRLKVLHQEIDDILPKHPGAAVSSPRFEEFMDRFRQIAPPELDPENDAMPTLIRSDPATL
jgi:predicted Zn-dependent protease